MGKTKRVLKCSFREKDREENVMFDEYVLSLSHVVVERQWSGKAGPDVGIDGVR